MTTANRNHLDSNIYARIESLPLSCGERTSAIAALDDGEKIAKAILSVAHILRLLFTMPRLKPSFKH
jgi:hypothetical protein